MRVSRGRRWHYYESHTCQVEEIRLLVELVEDRSGPGFDVRRREDSYAPSGERFGQLRPTFMVFDSGDPWCYCTAGQCRAVVIRDAGLSHIRLGQECADAFRVVVVRTCEQQCLRTSGFAIQVLSQRGCRRNAQQNVGLFACPFN